MEACGDEEEADVQTAIATVSLSGTLNEKLEAIAKAQFRGVEMFENDLLSFNGTPAEIRRIPAVTRCRIRRRSPRRMPGPTASRTSNATTA